MFPANLDRVPRSPTVALFSAAIASLSPALLRELRRQALTYQTYLDPADASGHLDLDQAIREIDYALHSNS